MVILAVSCQMTELEKAPVEKSAKSVRIGAVAEQTVEQTRTSLGTENKVLWSAGDQLAVFGNGDLTSSAIFSLAEGEEGKESAVFEGEDLEGDKLLAIYPASYVKPGSKISTVDGGYSVPVTIPQIQKYATNSFSDKNFLAVGIGTRNALKFKNVMGLLEISIWSGSARTVSQLEIISSENLAGNAEITFSENGTPELKWVSDTTKTLYLKFSSSVSVSTDKENPTKFYVIAPVGAFANGFAFNFRSGSSIFHLKNTDSDNTIIRSTVRQMPVYKTAFTFQTATTLYKPTVTDYSIKQTVYDSVSTEYYYHFCVAKANFMDGEGIDSVALFNYLKNSLTAQAKDSMDNKPDKYPDFATAANGAMRNKNLTFSNSFYNSCSFLAGFVSFDATEHGLTALTNIKASQGKTLDHTMYDEAGVNFNSDDACDINGKHIFILSSNNTYTPCTYVRFQVGKAAGFEGTATEVKYKIISLASFKSSISKDLTPACADAIINYFNSNGIALTTTSLNSFNNGTLINCSAVASVGTSYVVMARVKTGEETYSVYAKTYRTMSTARMWLYPEIVDNKDIKFISKCKIASVKYRVIASTNTKTMEDISSELDKEDEYAKYLTDTELAKLNAEGSFTKAYSAIPAGKGRYVCVRATNMAGDSFDFAAFGYVPAS